MRPLRTALLLSLFVTTPAARAREAVLPEDPDERLLKEAGVGTSNPDLLRLLRQRSETPASALPALIRQLGDDQYSQRQETSRRLVACGAMAIPSLWAAVNDKDAEIAFRAKECLAAMDRPGGLGAVPAAARLLARRRSAEAVAALLRFLPYAGGGETEEQVWLLLAALAPRDGKPDPALLAALKDAEPSRRAVAACLLGRSADRAARDAVRPLLDDADPQVRLRAAQGLLARRERAALPALIGLLEARPVAVAWQAEELLHWAAGADGPAAVVGAGDATEGKKCRAAWQEWWEKSGTRRDPTLYGQGVRAPGLLLLAGADEGFPVILRGCDGTTRWHLEQVGSPSDVRLLDGDRVLLANSSRITERNLGGEVLWQAKIKNAASCRRLPNGHTFFANAQSDVGEITPAGEIVYSTNDRPTLRVLFYESLPWNLANGRLAVLEGRRRNGSTIVQVDPARATIVGQPQYLLGWRHPWRVLDTLPDGGLLVDHDEHLCALDSRYRSVWECPLSTISASQWPDGQTVAVSLYVDDGRVTEIDREGRQVWAEDFSRQRAPSLARCCLGLVRVGFTDGPQADGRVSADLERRFRGLRHRDAEVRVRTVNELRAQGQRAAVDLPSLLRACNDPDADWRAGVRAALADLAPIRRSAFSAALHDSRAEVRAAGAGLLVLAGSPEQLRGHVPDLCKALKDGDVRVRLAAAATLAEVAPDVEGLTPELRRAVENHDLPRTARTHAAGALAWLGPRGLSALPAMKRLLAELETDKGASEDWLVVNHACGLLRLIAELKEARGQLRTHPLRQLGQSGEYASAAVPIVREYLKDPEPEVARAAANCLARIGPRAKAAVPALIGALNDSADEALRAEAALALGEIGPAAKAAVPALVALLKTPDGVDTEATIARRSSAAWALARLGPPAREAVPALERVARDDPSDLVRRQANDSLREIWGWGSR